MDIQELLNYKVINLGSFSLTIHKLVMLGFIFLFAKILIFSIKKGIQRRWRTQKLDKGSEYTLVAMIRYLIWMLAIVFALEAVGVKVTILIAGSAALLVGVGLGLQQTFNDIVSGIILLIEGSTRVEDVLEVDGIVVKLKHIGLRASKVINRDDIMIIIPNSLIVTNKVINWSHQVSETRFRVKVGVAYGSDVDLVIRILEDSVKEHKVCSVIRMPEGRFLDFGDSSLDFEVLFWTDEMFRIDAALSDIRRSIDAKFRENGVTIPFPQRDLHIKSSNVNLK